MEPEISEAAPSPPQVPQLQSLLNARRLTVCSPDVPHTPRPLPSPGSVPASIAREQARVPVIVRGRVSVVRVVFPVSAAVCGCGGKCLSVHLQVHQFVARARGVRGVAAAAVGAHQAQDQREEAHTWRHTQGFENVDVLMFSTSTLQLFGVLDFLEFWVTFEYYYKSETCYFILFFLLKVVHVNSEMGLHLYMYACIHNTHRYESVCLHIFMIQVYLSSCSVDVQLKDTTKHTTDTITTIIIPWVKTIIYNVFVHFHKTNMNPSSMRITIQFPHSRATKGVAISSLGSVPMPDKTCFIYCHWLSETCQKSGFCLIYIHCAGLPAVRHVS